MLLFCLVAFGLLGLLARYIMGSRVPVILLLSAGSIAVISPPSLLFCVVTAVINFFLLQKVRDRAAFIFSIVLNLLLLFAYHIYPIFREELWWADLIVILGFSYLTLQQIDYLFRVRFEQAAPPPNFLVYLTSVLYLPKFFSGPIASLPAVERQLTAPAPLSVQSGLNRILLGIFKKLVLAESVAPMVHSVLDFGDPYPLITLLAGALLYSLQLYFDFSGYSDIAIGISQVWGIQLPENFKFPFRQKSWTHFWKSWHSSLTEWLWQYVFNPLYLALSRAKFNKTTAILLCSLAVFTGMAFFNGVQSGFYVSAGILALLYFAERVLKLKENTARQIPMFLFFSMALLYFRMPAGSSYRPLTERFLQDDLLPGDWLAEFFAPLASGGSQHDYFNLTVSLILALGFLLYERKIFSLFSGDKIRYTAWFIMLLLIFLWGVFESGERFIYMQF